MSRKERGDRAKPGGEEERRERPWDGGLLPLTALNRPLDLPPDAYYARIMLLLLRTAEEACLDAARQAQLDQPQAERRKALAILERGALQRVLLLSSLASGDAEDQEQCLFWLSLWMEAGCALAQRMPDHPARRVIHFLLPEYLDALYRLANLYSLQTGKQAQALLGQYPEIMPGRPLSVCHRPPRDGVSVPWQAAAWEDEMALTLLWQASKQARRACAQAACHMRDGLSLGLMQEIALITSQHETQLSCLLPSRTPLFRLVLCHYTAAFLYDSCGWDETLPGPVRSLAMEEETQALRRLQCADDLLRQADPAAPPPPAFPPPLYLRSCKGYVRDALEGIGQTLAGDRIVPSVASGGSAEAARYRRALCPQEELLPSHRAVQAMIEKTGSDYRFEIARHPIGPLRDRTRDHTSLRPE